MKKMVFVVIALLCFLLIGCGKKQVNDKTNDMSVDSKVNLESKQNLVETNREQLDGNDGKQYDYLTSELASMSGKDVNESKRNSENKNVEIDNIIINDDFELVEFINNIDDKYTPAINSFHGYPIKFFFKNGITKAQIDVDNGSLELYELAKSKEIDSEQTSWYMDHNKEKEENSYTTFISIIFKNETHILGYAVLKIEYTCDSDYYSYYKGKVLKSALFPEINNKKQNITYEQVIELINKEIWSVK